MIACPQCGVENREDARFCSRCGAALQRPLGTDPLPANAVLQNRYRIIKMVGGGGMANVYQAEDMRFPGKTWAVKEMREELLPVTDRLPAIQAFTREAELLARLEHPTLPRVIDHFSEGGRHYLAMEYLEGQTLQQRIAKARNRPFKEQEVIEWAIQICDALDYLHSQDPPIIYRDLKPANIIVDRAGAVKLIDFGIARYFDPSKKTDTLKMGTTGYAPPEQYQGGGRTDARSDVYALGATMHHLLTGRDPQDEPPFSFGQARPRKLNPRLSEGIERVIMTALAYDPVDRYQSAAGMREALRDPDRPAQGRTGVMSEAPAGTGAAAVAAYTHEVTHLPQADDLFRLTLAEIEEQTPPPSPPIGGDKGGKGAAAEKQQQEEWSALYRRGTEAVQQRRWPEALEALDAIRTRDGAFTDVPRLALQAEVGQLQSLFPATASPPALAHAAHDWAGFSGAADLDAERAALPYVPPLNYPALRETLLRCHVLVLTGPPGIGKFSAAMALAREWNGDHEDWPIVLLRPNTPVDVVSEAEKRIFVWPDPFGVSTFAPPPLADRADVLERLLERNYLILTTTAPLYEMALCTTTLGLWPTLAEATLPLSRQEYAHEGIAELLERYADLAWRQGTITARQRDLLANAQRRLELAPCFHSPLAVRLFIEYTLAALDADTPWNTRDLQLMAADVQRMRQLFTRWFAALAPSTRVFLTVLTWLAERPQAEVWEAYAALTRHLQALSPGLSIASIGVLARDSRLCVSGRDRPRFKHAIYHELVREVVVEMEREYALQCLGEVEQAVLSAGEGLSPSPSIGRGAGGEGRRDAVPLNAALFLGELAVGGWECAAPSLQRLAALRSPDVKWALGRGLVHAAQKQPALLPAEISVLRQWAGGADLELRLATLEAARHLGRIALADVMPVLEQLAGDAHPAVRTGLADVAAGLAPAGWGGALALLQRLGNDPEVSIREAVSSHLIRLARWRRRAVLAALLEWAQDTASLLHGTVARVLLGGQPVFSLDEVVPVYRALLRRQDDAGAVIAAYLSDPAREAAWPLRALAEIARAPQPDTLQEMDHIFQVTAWQRPQIVVQVLTDWAHSESAAVRQTALPLMASVGQAQIQERDPATGLNVLGGVYREQWFGALSDLARDPLAALRARLVYLAPDFAHVDAARTVEVLALLSGDEMERIRQLTALALAPFAARYADPIVPVLENLVSDASPRVREATIPALADGVAQVEVIPAVSLLATLVRDPAITNVAAPAFISVASARVDGAAAALAALSKDTNPALRNALLEVAFKTGNSHPAITATFLAPLATDHNAALRERVVEACHVIAQRDPAAPLDVLVQLVLDQHPHVRELAMSELTAAGLKVPQEGLRAIRRLAQERRSEIKLLALQALSSFATDHAPAVLEAVDLLLRDPDLTVRRATVPAIAAAGRREPAGALERLGGLLLDLNADIRQEAQQQFLELCATHDARLLPGLSRLAVDTAPTVFLPALEGLARFVASQPGAVLEALAPVIKGDKAEAQEATWPLLERLAEVRLTAVVRTLAPLLRGERANESARRLYWRIVRLPEGTPIAIEPDTVIRSMAHNSRWDAKAARKALSFGEVTAFTRQRAMAKLTGKVK